MNLIDERGRLFGRVNVYDAAVVGLVLVAIAGGAVVVFDPFAAEDDGETVTRYVTLDLGGSSPTTAERIAVGDTDGGLTVTDTYLGPSDGENVSVYARVRVEGQLNGDRFEYAGHPLAPGAALDIETERYEMDGEVVALDTDGESLTTGTRTVLVETELSSAAVPVVRNDTYRIDNRTVGRVTGTAVEPVAAGRHRTALVALSLVTVSYDGRTYFGDRRLLGGQRVAVRTDEYALSGRVVRVGNVSLSRTQNRTVTIELHGADPAVADGFEPGLLERSGGTTTARITAVETEPTPVVGIDGNGTVAEGDHPRRVDVTLTVSLRVRETDDGLRFRTRPLREGDTVLLEFDTVVADGTVTDIDA